MALVQQAHKSSLTPLLFIEVPVPRQESECYVYMYECYVYMYECYGYRSCLCFLRCLDWILELFRQCGIFMVNEKLDLVVISSLKC
jgi:hypothetical protein